MDERVSIDDEKAANALIYLRDKIETDNQAWRLESAEMFSQTQVFLGFGTFVLVVIVALVSLLIFALNRLKYDNRLLKDANQYVEQLIDASPDGLFIVNEAGLVVRTNVMAESIFGGDSEAFSGKHVIEFLPQLHAPENPENDKSFVTSDTMSSATKQTNLKAKRVDKTEFDAEISLNRIRLRKDIIEIINVRDVTQQKAFELAAKNRTRLETIGQLTAGVAHDFNNILMTIVGNNELLKLQLGEEHSKLRKYIDSSAAATSRAAALTARLLAFGRKQALVISSFSIASALEDLIPALKSMLGESIEVTQSLTEDIWSLETDKEQLESAIINLSVNAKQAMANGGRLSICAENVSVDNDFLDEFGIPISGDFVCISVSDNGVGMSKDIQARIFEPFFTTKKAGKGSGLGLSMVYGFMQQSKGFIKVYSREGTGTTVQLFVPAAKRRVHAARQALDDKASESISLHQELVVLVVEDDDHVRRVAEDLLANIGVRTISAASPDEAITAASYTARLDVLFTDIILSSDKNGVELANDIKAIHPDVKVLYTTGYAQQEILSNISAAGRKRVLRKPYNATTLYKAIEKLLQEDLVSPS